MFMQIISKENPNKVIATYGIVAREAGRAAYVGYEYFYTAEKEATRVQIVNAPRGILPATGKF